MRVPSPRFYVCYCKIQTTEIYSPLAKCLQERTTPEWLYLEADCEFVIRKCAPANGVVIAPHIQMLSCRIMDPENWITA